MPSQLARRLLSVTTRATAEAYRRNLHLPGLLALWPAELADDSQAGRQRIVARLHRALRAERTRGRSGHWTYDLNRHIALLGALRAEKARLSGRVGLPSPERPLRGGKRRDEVRRRLPELSDRR